MTSDIIKFCESNPTDKRVAAIMKAMNRPLSLNGRTGQLIGELMRELEAR